MQLSIVEIAKPADANVIVGQAHFIKTVEDVYEALVQAVPGIKFGLAFCEASGPCLVRHTGTDPALENSAVEAASAIGAGHVFVVILGNAFPVNVLNQIKTVSEVCTIFCATANPLRDDCRGGSRWPRRGRRNRRQFAQGRRERRAIRRIGARCCGDSATSSRSGSRTPRWIRYRDAANLIDEAVTKMGGGRQPAKPSPAKKKPNEWRIRGWRVRNLSRRRDPARVFRDRILPRAAVRRNFRADRAASRRADFRDFLRTVPDSRRRRPRSQRAAGSAGAVELFGGAFRQCAGRVHQGAARTRALPASISVWRQALSVRAGARKVSTARESRGVADSFGVAKSDAMLEPEVIGRLLPGTPAERVEVQLGQLKPYLVKGLLASEDRFFYYHPGNRSDPNRRGCDFRFSIASPGAGREHSHATARAHVYGAARTHLEPKV